MKKNEPTEKEKTNPLTAEESKLLWDNISSNIKKKEQKKLKQLGMLTAVVIMVFIGLIGYDIMISPDQYLAKESNLEITLKDGTAVTLLKDSELTVEKSFPSRTRDVFLQGNAIFRVTKSKEYPFIVHGAEYKATVLGTSFKVMQEHKAFKVDLYEGKVAVTRTGDHSEVHLLRPQETFNNYGNEKIAAISPIKGDLANKKEPTGSLPKTLIHLQFDGCRLQDALQVIEKTYAVKVNYPSSYGDKTISMEINGMSAGEVLQSIALSLGLQLKQYDQNYQLEN